MKATGMLWGGRVVECDQPVFNWHDHGMEFKPGDGARKRVSKEALRLMIWHWTGGEGTMEALFRVLHHREPPLGVEFGIDVDGDIFQFADPELVDTFDAGPYNPVSAGCEITNYGFTGEGRAPANPKRGTYEMMLNGRRREFARFFPAQLRAARALAEAISRACPGIPKQVPTRGGALFGSTMNARQLRDYRGHLGHFHLTNAKSDPGGDLLGSFIRDGFKGSEVAP